MIGAGKPVEQETRQLGITKSLKTMFVLATRAGLSSNLLQSVDPVISKAKNNVSLDYPVTQLEYPGIWLTTSFNSLKWNSINGELIHPDGYKYNIGEFDATINFEVIALSNEERDAMTDALANMVMFGSLETDSDAFYRFLVEEPYIALTPLLGEVKLSQDGVNIGTPWDPNQIAYTKTISFSVVGEFAQRLDNKLLIPLREIHLSIYGKNNEDIHSSIHDATGHRTDNDPLGRSQSTLERPMI